MSDRVIYCVPILPHRSLGIDIGKVCWGSCGKGLVGGIDVGDDGGPCIPCDLESEKCPHFDKQSPELGTPEFGGETLTFVVRKLRLEVGRE